MSEQIKKTPLYDIHKELGAKFTDFCSWQMPVQYSGVIEEHKAVRSKVGLFDVSHMGEIIVSGPKALEFLQYVTTNDVSRLIPGKAHYTLFLNKEAGVVDDLIIYQLGVDEYFLCVNACNTTKDFDWLNKHNQIGAEICNVSNSYAQIAVQGPNAMALLDDLFPLVDTPLSKEKPFSIHKCRAKGELNCGEEVLIALTGYTGEKGAEVFCKTESAALLWNALLNKGKEYGAMPIGLGARDTLRLEAGYPLHGHEIKDDLNVGCSGLGWVIKKQKGEFIGRDAIEVKGENNYKLVGLEVTGRGVVRADAAVFHNGQKVGWVTSGTFTPTTQKSIAMAYIEGEYGSLNTELEAEVRGRYISVKVIELPFYKRS